MDNDLSTMMYHLRRFLKRNNLAPFVGSIPYRVVLECEDERAKQLFTDALLANADVVKLDPYMLRDLGDTGRIVFLGMEIELRKADKWQLSA